MWHCEYSNDWRIMRQNPVLQSRLQVGGRPMPAWFSASLVNQARALAPTPPPPPLPIEPPPEEDDESEESEYEEIEHLPKYSNMNMNAERRSSGSKMTCGLCGNPNPLVRCEMCNNQIFCGSCNDMYHRHPKRHNHTRKILEHLENRPPLPPKAYLPPQPEHQQVNFFPQTPVPPPRRNRRFGMRSEANSPTMQRKPSWDPTGSLKRFVGLSSQHPQLQQRPQSPAMVQRPLPPPPVQSKADFNRPMTARFSTKPGLPNSTSASMHQLNLEDRRQSAPFQHPNNSMRHPPQRSSSISSNSRASPSSTSQMPCIPLTVLEMSNRNARGSEANLCGQQPPGRGGFAYPGWENEVSLPRNQRAYSVSTSNLNRFPVSNSDASHFATLQRPKKPPVRPPPPVPPRDFSQQHMTQRPYPQHPHMYPSASVFELDRAGAFVPWMHPDFEFQQQQAAMMGYPGTLRRTGSTCSTGRGQEAFGWNPNPMGMSAFGPPMTQAELNMEIQSRRESEPPHLPAYGNQQEQFPGSNLNRSGSLRRKSQPSRPESNPMQQSPNRPMPMQKQMQQMPRVPTPILKPVRNPEPQDEYYSAEPEEQGPDGILTENPEGPWSCEHCTFVNTKSTKICIICCKTPVEGYRVITGKNGRNTPFNSAPARKKTEIPEDSNVVQSKLTFSNSKSQPSQKINLSVEQVCKPPRTIPPPEQIEADSEDSEESEEEDEVTQRPRYPSRDPEKSKVVNGTHAVPQQGQIPLRNVNKQTSSVSTGVGSSPPPTAKSFVDSGTGEYSIHEPIRILKSSSQEVKAKADQSMSTNKFQETRKENTKKSMSTLTSGSSSPFPTNRGFTEFDRRSSRGTSPPPQTISTQTYEEIPASKLRQQTKSISKSSIQSSGEMSPPRMIESDKALRYARRAQQQSKLKRSMSTHLTSTSSSNDPWIEGNHRSRHASHHNPEGRHLYRSSSRHSLASDTRSLPISGPPSRDTSPRRGRYQEDFRRFPTPSWERFPSPGDYFASIEDLVVRKRRESMRSQEFELSRLLKEAEEFNYTPEDLQTALRMCGDRNPIKWLQENWASMIETVQTLATKYGRDKGQEQNEVGTISPPEAKEALRLHRGNVWAAVTECVEQRRKKFLELQSRGSFLREDILTALTANQGNLDAAYVELSKAQLKPFLMRIWGPPSGQDNEALPPPSPSLKSSVVDLELSPPPVEKKVIPVKPEVVATSNKSESVSTTFPSVVPVPLAETQKEDQVLPVTNASTKVSVEVLPEPEVKAIDLELEDEVFFDPDPVKPELERTQSLSDPELDESEANVSHFIQNFEVPPPPANPIIPPLNPTHPSTNPVSPLSSGAMKRTEDEKSTETSSEQAIASLAQAVNAINEKLGTFMKQHESLSSSVNTGVPTEKDSISPHTPAPLPNDQIEGNKIGKVTTESPLPPSKNRHQSETTTETKTHSIQPSPTEVQALKNIYKDELQVLKQIVLTNDVVPKPSIVQAQGQAPVPEAKPVVKSGPSKLYEALGNFAGSFLKSARRTPKPQVEENIYETVKVEKGVPEKSNQNEILAALLQEQIASNAAMQRSPSPLPSTSKMPEIDDIVPLPEFQSEPVDDQPLSSGTSSESLPISVEDDDERRVRTSSSSGSGQSQAQAVKPQLLELRAPLSHGKGSLESSESEEEDDEELGLDEPLSESDGESSGDIDGEQSSSGSYSEDESENEMEGDQGQVYEEMNLSQGQGQLSKTPDVAKVAEPASVKPAIAKAALQATEPTPTPAAKVIPVPAPTAPQKTKTELGIQKLLESGQASSQQTAELAMKLMDMNFAEEDSLLAARECSSLYAAISFLQQECLLCSGKFSAKQMVSMLRCTHRCCRTCAADYFTVQIRDNSIVDCTCPFCKEPSNLGEETELAPDYFSHLDMLLKDLLEERVHEMFQRKLRDSTLAKTPNFKWCSKCSSGFITEPIQTHLVCPDCNAVTCAICLEPWDKFNHDHRDRGDLSRFCDAASSSSGAEPKSIIDYLNENCIECPRCHLRFALARGGCMHLTCSQCRYEFCSGCTAPFRMGAKCNQNSPFCAKLGLHAHHPRNCLFYLRDKEPQSLATLLKENKITFQSGSVDSTSQPTLEVALPASALKCKVPIQKETDDGIIDDICGQETSRELPEICSIHYVEYLGLLIFENHLDPISILSSDDLETIIKRAHKRLPPKPYGIKDADYRPQLLKVIGDEIPL